MFMESNDWLLTGDIPCNGGLEDVPVVAVATIVTVPEKVVAGA